MEILCNKFWDILNFFENLLSKEIDFHFFLQLLVIEGKYRNVGTWGLIWERLIGRRR